ncbi:type II toxin-antitoxin system RelE/ParE family toxin [Niabella sp. CJ426]|jgi:plasmid stabilization system protein ParE|uniref:type II toxin-antitoxin system RelE/ParE family toxin n=1 Tax=Niabella sp. CJ426 TaxID=3393740 RepID=UPI003CFCB720
MKSGYKIVWTDNAISELQNTVEYLESEFGVKELNHLAHKIESVVILLQHNPYLFSESEFKGVRKVNVLKLNTLYFRINAETVEILSFFSNRQNPAGRKL